MAAWRRRALAASMAMVAALGCSSSGTDAQGGAGTGGITLTEYWQGLFGLYCDSMAGCCQAAGMPFDDAACRAPIIAGSDPDYAPPPAGNIDFDGAAAAACLAALRAERAGCAVPSENEWPAVCAGVMGGRVPEGGACARPVECAGAGPDTGVDCGHYGETEGVCVHSPRGALGDPCYVTCSTTQGCNVVGSLETASRCYHADGLYCSSDGTCAAVLTEGAPCDPWSFSCAETLACRSVDGTAAPTCTSPAALGAPCQDDAECASGICVLSGTGVGGSEGECASSHPPPEVSEYLCAGNRE